MNSYKFFVVMCLCIAVGVSAEENFQECLTKDSITCVQNMVFRKARDFFEQQNINVVGGLSFVKSGERGAKSLDETVDVTNADNVEARENALEDYVVGKVTNFFTERSLNWNLASTARAIAQNIPEEVSASVRSLVVEGRKKKKIIKQLLPLLLGLKVKLAGLAILALFAVGFIAKKALLVSFISLILSIFLLIKKVLAKKLSLISEVGSGFSGSSFHGGNGGSYGNSGNGGWDSYGAYSAPVAQQLAYNGHHKVARR